MILTTNTHQVFDKRSSLPTNQKQLRKSRSLTTEKPSLMVDMTLKRRSTGCIRQPSYYSSTSNNNTTVTKVLFPH